MSFFESLLESGLFEEPRVRVACRLLKNHVNSKRNFKKKLILLVFYYSKFSCSWNESKITILQDFAEDTEEFIKEKLCWKECHQNKIRIELITLKNKLECHLRILNVSFTGCVLQAVFFFTGCVLLLCVNHELSVLFTWKNIC